GYAYVAGWTSSTNFPATSGAFQTTNRGGNDLFVSKLNLQGGAVYSTLVGGSGNEFGLDYGGMIAVDASGNAFVLGMSRGADYPVTSNGTQKTQSGAGVLNYVISEVNNAGTALSYSSYLGGSSDNRARALAIGGGSRIYVA